MNKSSTLNELKNELAQANRRIEILKKQLHEADQIRRLVVAAGLIDEEKFIQAADLIDRDNK